MLKNLKCRLLIGTSVPRIFPKKDWDFSFFNDQMYLHIFFIKDKFEPLLQKVISPKHDFQIQKMKLSTL